MKSLTNYINEQKDDSKMTPELKSYMADNKINLDANYFEKLLEYDVIQSDELWSAAYSTFVEGDEDKTNFLRSVMGVKGNNNMLLWFDENGRGEGMYFIGPRRDLEKLYRELPNVDCCGIV